MRNPNLASFNRPALLTGALTRPADTTAYAAGDVIATSTTAPAVKKLSLAASMVGGWGMIEAATLHSSANQATKPQIDVYLFTAAVGLDNDNAAFTPTDAEMLTCAGVLSFYNRELELTAADAATNAQSDLAIVGDATSGAGGNCMMVLENLNKKFKCADASRDLWWVMVARNAYTPVSGETFTLNVTVMQDR